MKSRRRCHGQALKRLRCQVERGQGEVISATALFIGRATRERLRDKKKFSGPLFVCDELRDELGLAPNDSLRVLRSDVRTLLLERVSESAGFAVPWDRDLVLSASVQAFPLADLLSVLHRSSKSGFLLFGFSDHEKAVYLHRGEVVFAASNQGVDRLGECLLRSGILTLEQLRDAEKRWDPKARLGKVLVERGVLTPRELWDGVKL